MTRYKLRENILEILGGRALDPENNEKFLAQQRAQRDARARKRQTEAIEAKEGEIWPPRVTTERLKGGTAYYGVAHPKGKRADKP